MAFYLDNLDQAAKQNMSRMSRGWSTFNNDFIERQHDRLARAQMGGAAPKGGRRAKSAQPAPSSAPSPAPAPQRSPSPASWAGAKRYGRTPNVSLRGPLSPPSSSNTPITPAVSGFSAKREMSAAERLGRGVKFVSDVSSIRIPDPMVPPLSPRDRFHMLNRGTHLPEEHVPLPNFPMRTAGGPPNVSDSGTPSIGQVRAARPIERKSEPRPDTSTVEGRIQSGIWRAQVAADPTMTALNRQVQRIENRVAAGTRAVVERGKSVAKRAFGRSGGQPAPSTTPTSERVSGFKQGASDTKPSPRVAGAMQRLHTANQAWESHNRVMSDAAMSHINSIAAQAMKNLESFKKRNA